MEKRIIFSAGDFYFEEVKTTAEQRDEDIRRFAQDMRYDVYRLEDGKYMLVDMRTKIVCYVETPYDMHKIVKLLD